MLINDFYTCHDVVAGDSSFNCLVIFNADHAIFGGHFPDQPVVPGVCMMEIVKELTEQQIGKSLMLHTAGNVKFLQLITPDVKPFLSITWKVTDEGYSVNAAFKSESSAYFKIDGRYVVA